MLSTKQYVSVLLGMLDPKMNALCSSEMLVTTVVPQSSGLYGVRGGPDYLLMQTTKGKLCGMCNIQHDRQCTYKHKDEVRLQTTVAVEKQ